MISKYSSRPFPRYHSLSYSRWSGFNSFFRKRNNNTWIVWKSFSLWCALPSWIANSCRRFVGREEKGGRRSFILDWIRIWTKTCESTNERIQTRFLCWYSRCSDNRMHFPRWGNPCTFWDCWSMVSYSLIPSILSFLRSELSTFVFSNVRDGYYQELRKQRKNSNTFQSK